MAGESKRPARVAAQLREEIARVLGRDLSDPRLEGLVVSSAQVSADLRVAKIGWRLAAVGSATELDARRKEAAAALDRASGRLKREAATRLGLRVAPELRFHYDEGQDARDRVDEILEEIKRDRK